MRRAEGELAYLALEGWRGVVRELGGLAPFPSGSTRSVRLEFFFPEIMAPFFVCEGVCVGVNFQVKG
jgi:hypothetical protein